MTTAFLYDAQGHDREIDLDGTLPDLGDGRLLWIDLDRGDHPDVAAVLAMLELPEAAAATSDAPAVVRHQRYFQFAWLLASGSDPGPKVDFLVGDRWLLTLRDGECPAFVAFREQDRAETLTGQLDAPALAASLLDWLIEEYFTAAAAIDSAIDGLDEAALLGRAERKALGRLASAQRRTARLRRRLAVQRQVVHSLLRPDFDPVVQSPALPHFQAVEAHFQRAVDAVDRARDSVVGSFELFATQTALDTNDLVKVLTFVTVIIGFAAAVAGIFGMNFQTSFTGTGEHGFHIVVGTMAAVSIGAAILARRRGWI